MRHPTDRTPSRRRRRMRRGRSITMTMTTATMMVTPSLPPLPVGSAAVDNDLLFPPNCWQRRRAMTRAVARTWTRWLRTWLRWRRRGCACTPSPGWTTPRASSPTRTASRPTAREWLEMIKYCFAHFVSITGNAHQEGLPTGLQVVGPPPCFMDLAEPWMGQWSGGWQGSFWR
jgi:hypothetical protein